MIFKKALCVLFSILLTLPLLSLITYAKTDNYVTEVDILIKTNFFKKLLLENNKGIKFPIYANINGDGYSVTLNTKGSSSYSNGLETESKRLPFELTFELPVSIGSFKNISSLKLNNNFSLYYLAAEYTALKIYEHMDIPVSECSPVFITFNDIDFGLYLGVEDINSEFLYKNFGPDALKSGNLYKSVDVDDTTVADNINYFSTSCFGTLSFKGGNENHKTLLSFLDAIDNKGNFEQYLNMDEVLRFFACTAASGGTDTILSSYHNIYLYEQNGKISFIPWDLSFAFDCFDDYQCINPDYEHNSTNIFFNLIMQREENRKKYYEYIEEIRETFLKPEISEPFISEFLAQVEEYYKRDRSTVFNKELSLKCISNGNVLANGNICLAISEAYRQLGEQMSGVSDYFYTPDSLHPDIFSIVSEEEVLSGTSSQVLEDICKNYYKAYLKNFVSWQLYTVIAVFILFFITVFILYRIPKGRRRKRNKT